MTIYVVVKDTSDNNVHVGSKVLGAYSTEEGAINRVNEEYASYVDAQKDNPSLTESCYITNELVHFKNDDVINLSKEACPEPDCFFHQTDESIYCMGFIEGYKLARAQNT